MSDKKQVKKNDRGATRKDKTADWQLNGLLWGKRLAFAGLILGGLFVSYLVEQAVEDSMSWPVSKVSIQGEYKHVKKEELVEMIKPFIGQSFLSINLVDIKQRLEDEPTIYRAVIARNWPDTLVVSIVEQTPFAKWGEGELLNIEGDIFKLTKSFETDGDYLPKLVGSPGSEKTVLAVYKKMTEMLAERGVKIAELNSDEKGAYKAILNSKIVLNIGKDDIESRVTRFLTVFDQQLKSQMSRVAAVDLRYSNGVAVSWNKELDSNVSGLENHSDLKAHLAER